MGTGSQILLVIARAASLLSPAMAVQNPAAAGERQAFWLWSGVKPTDALRSAQVVYVHQGDVVIASGQAEFERKGLPVSRLN